MDNNTQLVYTKKLLEREHRIIDMMLKNTGIYYYEYDPNLKSAVKINFFDHSEQVEEYWNFPEVFIKKYICTNREAEKVRYYVQKMEQGSEHEVFECQIYKQEKVHWYQIELIANSKLISSTCEKIGCFIKEITLQKEAELAYKYQSDVIMHMDTNAVSTFKLNLTQNICEYGTSIYPNIFKLQKKGTAVGYISGAISNIPALLEQWQFLLKFKPENLMDSYQMGEVRISLRHSYNVEKGNIRRFETIAEVFKNPNTGDVEAIVYSLDQTEEYLDNSISKLLFGKQYENIGVLYSREDRIIIRSFKNAKYGADINTRGLAYKAGIEWAAQYCVSAEDQEKFIEKTKVSVIEDNLQKRGEYFITYYALEQNEARRLKKITYYYLNQSIGLILTVSEDITNVLNQDLLTGECNQNGFVDKLHEIISRSKEQDKYAIFYFNIKGFKAINEMLGIEGSDEVLREIYKNLKSSFLAPVLCARTEVDHFALLVRQEKINLDEMSRLCQFEYYKEEKKYYFYLKCGIYMIDNLKISAIGMCDRAKMAEALIKDDFIRPYSIFDQSMQEEYMTQSVMSSELTDSLARNEFEVYFQPVICVETRKIVSAEALIRWNHPKLGVISPGRFVPTFEESGSISQLDLFVEKTVFEWQKNRINRGQRIIPIAMNLSRMDFYHTFMMEKIINDLKMSDFPSGAIRYEVTESAYSALEEDRNEVLNSLKKYGAKILVDDFGSGYSSFSAVQDFNFDIIKLDMGFTQKIGKSVKAEKIIHSIIEMAHNLGAEIIAEGVETKQQVTFLKKQKCDYIQGYYFYKPMTQQDFEYILEKEK